MPLDKNASFITQETARSVANSIRLWSHAFYPEDRANLTPLQYSTPFEANFLLGLREGLYEPKGLLFIANFFHQAKRPLAIYAILQSGQLRDEQTKVNMLYKQALDGRQETSIVSGDVFLLDRNVATFTDAHLTMAGDKLSMATIVEAKRELEQWTLCNWENGQWYYVTFEPYQAGTLEQVLLGLQADRDRVTSTAQKQRVDALDGIQTTLEQLNQVEKIPYNQTFERNFLIALREKALSEAQILRGLDVLNDAQRLQGVRIVMRHHNDSKVVFLRARDYANQMLKDLPPLPPQQKCRVGEITSYSVEKPLLNAIEAGERIGSLAPETLIRVDKIHTPRIISATNLETDQPIILQI